MTSAIQNSKAYMLATQDGRVFRNTAFKTRDYEATNIAACTIYEEGATVKPNYVAADPSILNTMTPLWIENGIQYWGWL